MVSWPSSTATDARKRERGSKKENDLHKSIIQSKRSSAVTLAACLYSSILKGACWQPHLIKGCGSLTFHVKKDCHWVTQTFFSPLFSRSVQGNDIGIQICGCYFEQMSPLAGKGNGTSRNTLSPGAKQHSTTGLQRGQEAGGMASTSERFTSLPSTLLFPSLQLSSKNICLLFLRRPPLTSVLASPWPILSIVVDVMTKNKQREGVRLPFVWAGRSPSLLPRGRISPDEHSHFLLLLTAPDRYMNTDPCICGGSDVKNSHRIHFVSWLLSWSHCPFTAVWMTCRRKVQ